MSRTQLLDGVRDATVQTSRLAVYLLGSGRQESAPVLFVHGNLSSSRFWEETLSALPDRYRGLAPDLRGFGASEQKPVAATRGLRDFSDDLHALTAELRLPEVHLVGWSMGGGIAMQYAIDHPGEVASLVLVAPLSPYGFGGTRDVDGTPCWPDFAGSGGGTVNPEFLRRLSEGDAGDEDPNSPRQVMNTFYFRPPYRVPADREEAYVAALLQTRTGDGNYPGSMTSSQNWPGIGPGPAGVNNTMAPCFCDLSGLARTEPRPDVLWIRGQDDQIVSDTSMFDLGYLGQIGAVPGWPGPDVYPAQPMIAQTRAVLERYRSAGGSYREEVLAACGHSPHVEKPAEFQRLLLQFLDEQVPVPRR